MEEQTMSKQTAVQWLWERFNDGTLIPKSFEIAKAMEKEQIVDAFTKGDLFSSDYFDGVNITCENYYNETYGGGQDV